jgi:hypothetical protein
MIPIKHPLCNDVLRAPEGDDTCDDLHIAREGNEVWSFWTPNAEELAAIVTGGVIALRVAGQTHPPLSLHVMTPEVDRRKCETADEIKAVYEANRVRCNALLRITKRVVAELVKATGDQHEAIVNEFVDLMAFNVGKCEVVRNLEEPEPTKA